MISSLSRLTALTPASGPVREVKAPKTVNDRLAVFQAQHRTNVFRVENRLVRLLDDEKEKLKDGLDQAARMLPSVGGKVRQTGKIPAQVSKAIDDAFYRFHLRVVNVFDEELEALAEAEPKAQAKIIKTAIEKTGGGAIKVRAAKKEIRINFKKPPIGELRVLADQPLGGVRWADRVADYVTENEEAIRQIFHDGIATGLATDEIARKISGEVDTGFSSAYRLARTEISRVQSEASKAFFKANDDVLQGWQFMAAIDDRTCPVCMEIDRREKVYKFGTGPDIPVHPNCRCVAVPVLKSWEDMGIDDEDLPEGLKVLLDGDPAELRGSNSTFGDFFCQFSQRAQMDILGSVGAFKAYRAGKLKIESFRDLLCSANAPMDRELTADEAVARLDLL